MKKKTMIKVLSALSIASFAFIFAGCGKKDKPTTKPQDEEIKKKDGFSYKVSVDDKGNKVAEIVAIDKKGAELVIPDNLDGNVVTRMSCTYTDDELIKVTIPASLTYLTGNGFMNCENLSSVTFSGTPTIADIPSKAFLGTKLKSIEIPASVRTISFEAFQDVDTLTEVTFAEGSILETVGPFAFYGCDGITSITLPNELMTIGESAFEKCENLTTLTISGSTKLTAIEQYAFSGCIGLTSLDFTPNTVLEKIGANAFRGCTNISSVTFDEALKEIGSKAFYNTQKITNVVLPSNLTSVGDEAFVNAGLTTLEIKSGSDTNFGTNAFTQYRVLLGGLVPEEKITKITINGNLSLEKVFTDYTSYVKTSLTTLKVTGDSIAPSSYKGCINLTDLTIDPKIVAIGESAFENCTLITEVTLNDELTEIAANTFKNCINLSTIVLPENVTIIRTGAFEGCVNIASLDLSHVNVIGANAFRNTLITTPTFSSKLQSIDEYAFENCTNIEEVIIDTTTSSTTIGKYAFNNCTKIEEINLSKNVIVNLNAFANDTNVETLVVRGEYGLDTLFGESKESASTKIKYVTIQDDTEKIEDGAFAGCMLVTSINIPDTVTVIGEEAFRGCRGITTLNLPTTLEKVGKFAFADCDKLNLGSLPSGIIEISEGLFMNDFTMGEFELNSKTTKIGAYAFCGCSNLSIDELNDKITYIGAYAFSGCLNLELDELPTDLETLGDCAFNGCLLVSVNKTNDSLARIGEYAFRGCQGIKSFEFSSDLMTGGVLGNAILEGCTKVESLSIYGTTSLEYLFGESVTALKPVLSSVTIKEGSTELANNMFKGFTALSTVNLPTETIITKIGESAFEDCLSLSSLDISKVLEIGNGAFAGSGLISIEIPTNGIILGTGIFANCTSLATLTFGNIQEDDSLNIKEIPASTFEGTILVDVFLPETVTTIGDKAFSNILTLNSFTISENSQLYEISNFAFAGCSNILNFYIPKYVSLIGEEAFEGCTALRNVTFSENCTIEKISFKAFKDCYALTIINLPDTIREIGDNAFENCTCLVDLDLPETLEILGVSVFAGCQSLNNLTIPEKIETIPTGTFKNCFMLENVIWNTNIKIIEDEAFFNTPYKTALPKTIFQIGVSAFASEDKKPKTFVNVDLKLGTDSSGVSLYIGDSAFAKSGIKSIELGAKVTDLGNGIFAESNIVSADFSNLKITKIGNSMFEKCVLFESVALGTNSSINTIGDKAFAFTKIGNFDFSKILSIGDSAFEEAGDLGINIELGVDINVTIGTKAFYKSGITGLKLGEKVIKLGGNAFAETSIASADLSGLSITAISDFFFAKCSNLESVKINSNIRTIGTSAFTGTKIKNISFLNIATELEQIMPSAFESCEYLKVAVIPSTVSFVGTSAFKGCKELTSLIWSTSANVINTDTFNGCNKLTEVVIPSNVSRIGKSAFTPVVAEPNHATIAFESVTPPSVDEAFATGFDTIDIIVPNGSIDAYMKNYVFASVVVNINYGIKVNVDGYSGVYDGLSHNVVASYEILDEIGTATVNWEVRNTSDSGWVDSLEVTNVSESGYYFYKATVSLDDGVHVTIGLFKVTIEQAIWDISSSVQFNSDSFAYDGEPHSLEITGTLPDHVTVSYNNNNQKEIGDYEVAAQFTIGEESDHYGNYIIEDMVAILSIEE